MIFTPVIIKFRFHQLACENPAATHFCVNKGEAMIPEELSGRAYAIDSDISRVVAAL